MKSVREIYDHLPTGLETLTGEVGKVVQIFHLKLLITELIINFCLSLAHRFRVLDEEIHAETE